MARTRSAARSPDRTDPFDGCRATPYQSSRPRETGFSGPSRRPAAARSVPAWPRRCAAFAHDLPGRQIGHDARGFADIPPDRLRQFLTRQIHQPVGAADGDRQPLRERKPATPPARPRPREEGAGPQVDRTGNVHSRSPGILRASSGPGSSAEAGRGGTASTTASPGPTAIVSSPNFNSPMPSADMPKARSSCPNWMLAPLPCSSLIAGSTSTALRPSRAINGRQATPPANRVSRTIAPGEARGSLRRIDIERRQQQGLHQPVVQRALAGNGVADQFALPCPDQRHQGEVIEQARIGHAPRFIEDP